MPKNTNEKVEWDLIYKKYLSTKKEQEKNLKFIMKHNSVRESKEKLTVNEINIKHLLNMSRKEELEEQKERSENYINNWVHNNLSNPIQIRKNLEGIRNYSKLYLIKNPSNSYKQIHPSHIYAFKSRSPNYESFKNLSKKHVCLHNYSNSFEVGGNQKRLYRYGNVIRQESITLKKYRLL